MIKLGILISGRGSNMAAVLQAISHRRLDAQVVLVISNKATAKGLEVAQSYGVPTLVTTDEAEMVTALRAAEAEYVILAGYMRLVGPVLLTAFEGKMINIHPSLLPSFKGLHAQKQALDAGVKLSGCTTHFVTADLDGGPIILQAAVPVLDTDTVESLSDRILQEEHPLLVQTLSLISEGNVFKNK